MRLKRPPYKETHPDLLKLLVCVPTCKEFKFFMKEAVFGDFKVGEFFHAYEQVCLDPYSVPCSYCNESDHPCFEEVKENDLAILH